MTRVGGAFMALGGLSQTVAGASTVIGSGIGTVASGGVAAPGMSPLAIIGSGVTVHGLDQVWSGWRTVSTGSSQRPYAAEALDTVTGNPTASDWLNGVGGMLATGGAHVATRSLAGAATANATATAGPRVFWSGGKSAMEAAESFAKANGGTTLEMTAAGQRLTQTTKSLDWATQAKPMWETASASFARGASGEVQVFQNGTRGVSLESIWRRTEYPILQQQQNKVIYHVIMPNGIITLP